MTTLRLVRAFDVEDEARGERRLIAAQRRYGLPMSLGSVIPDLRAGTGVLMIADGPDDDDDADIGVHFHHEPEDIKRLWWIYQVWGRSNRILRVYETLALFCNFMGIRPIRFGVSELPYTKLAMQVARATLSADGSYWEADPVIALPIIRQIIQQQNIPQL